jgi:PiT family inorganic phosphate transporter
VVVLVALVVSPAVGLLTGLLGVRASDRALRRATRKVRTPVIRGQFASAAVLAFGHGANDAAKAGGVIVVLLVATGHSSTTSAPLWVTLLTAATLTIGTAVGGWRIVRTIGLRIFRLRPLDGFVTETGSALVVVGASVIGAPVSTSQVVASTVAGVGSGRRWHHVRWSVFGVIGLAWLLTFPVCLALGALLEPVWRSVA